MSAASGQSSEALAKVLDTARQLWSHVHWKLEKLILEEISSELPSKVDFFMS